VQDKFDDQPNSLTHLLRDRDGEPGGTIRVCVYSAAFACQRIPVFDLYGEELFEDGGRAVLAQSTYFAVAGTGRGRDLLPKLLLVQALFRTTIAAGAERLVSVVSNRPAKLAFYARLGLAPAGPVKMHPWANQPVVLIALRPEPALRMVRSSDLVKAAGDFDERAVAAAGLPGLGARLT
jgi:hypothetical protein